jgi:hypothetical protein
MDGMQTYDICVLTVRDDEPGMETTRTHRRRLPRHLAVTWMFVDIVVPTYTQHTTR